MVRNGSNENSLIMAKEKVRVIKIVMKSGEILVSVGDDLYYNAIKINNDERYTINTCILRPHANGTDIDPGFDVVINSNFIESKRTVDFIEI